MLRGYRAELLSIADDPAATPLLARRTAGKPLADRLFALQILGDDRVVARTYVAGRCVHDRDTPRSVP